MAGGLIQIVSYGSQDLFLTGSPEITFFKVVYRRHTNFAMESVELEYIDNIGFGKEATIIFPKAGDLIHKIYAKITLPKMDLKRNDATNDFESDLDTAYANWQAMRDFMEWEAKVVTAVLIQGSTANKSFSDDMGNTAQSEYRGTGTSVGRSLTEINTLRTTLEAVIGEVEFLNVSSYGSVLKYEATQLGVAVTNYTTLDANTTVDNLTNFKSLSQADGKAIINGTLARAQDKHKELHDEYLSRKAIHEDESNIQLKFAWIDKIGHAIIDRTEVEIGGVVIERQYGDWLNIWYELAGKKENADAYNKMIGNVSELTTLDRTIKQEYDLYIPLQFWFCRHSGLSIPLVALQYHEVSLRLKLRKLEECGYIEENRFIDVPFLGTIFLDEISNDLGIDLKVTILADYIYLDSQERKRFAQSSHEYLIEQLQMDEFKSVEFQKMRFHLDFDHPCKEMIWVSQQQSFRENLDGSTKCRWDNYGLNTDGTGNPIINSEIVLHGYDLAVRKHGNWYNYVLPYNFHSNTPSDGINIYPFSHIPEEYQPGGSINFSRIKKGFLNIEFDSTYFPEGQDPTDLIVRIYVVNYNILRIIGGMAVCAYKTVI